MIEYTQTKLISMIKQRRVLFANPTTDIQLIPGHLNLVCSRFLLVQLERWPSNLMYSVHKETQYLDILITLTILQ